MITPADYEQLVINSYGIDDIIKTIDSEIVRYASMRQFSWVHLIINEEYPVYVRNEIGKEYTRAGWYQFYHRTSGEKNERYGITTFILTTKETDPLFREAFMKNGDEYIMV